jgi:lipopolysaccharide export system permease protein
MMKIWERYFLREVLKSFFFFILIFYGLYVLIDYSSHSSSFQYSHSRFKLYEIAVYYLFQFVERMEVLIPFGLLIATIRTLTNLNIHNELVALMASGVKIRTLLRPFILVGLAMVMLMYINTQFWMPYASQRMNHIEQKHRSQKNKTTQTLAVQNLALKDQTSVIFQNYDSIEKKLIDAFWIRDIDDIYRIKYLYPYHEIPTGHFVEHLQRGPGGQLTIVETSDVKQFPEMHFHKRDLFQGMIAPEDESLTDLWKKLPQNLSITSEKESETLSVFYHKLIMPWLCLLAVIGPAPFCVRYNRNMPLFFIYALSIFGLVAVYLVLDSTQILGKRQILEPWLAILIPFFVCSAGASYKYVRLNT